MMDLGNSKTRENLEKAFGGESQARNKYTYFAEVAESEGYHQIAEIFRITAENEKMHAKLWAAGDPVVEMYEGLILLSPGRIQGLFPLRRHRKPTVPDSGTP